jgi:NADH-quinone oxidoreductase subunit N
MLLLLSLLGMLFVVSSNDLFFLYLSIELMSLPLYILLGSKKSIMSIESSVKYFITGSIISVFMLLGVSLIYGYFGTTNYLELKDLLMAHSETLGSEELYIGFCFLLILATFFFKLGLAPFHFWVTDLYEGAPLTVIYFIALVPKLAMFIAFYRLFVVTLGGFFLANFYVYEIYFALGLFSVFVGS